ncbi:Polysaccharide biosynthesis protein [Polystyrenella longa]|uniref:Polysaccharide biosynthesis protein n=1 Tax=Polystyrenella longa TaxID=2528007 RepID=A0A518CUB4_9PLAN|nr:lipopolysaccharide biosynthesis protein [Polystyrenella longa]QDU82817.1 Polysaccharide biosynthesis protein [Polystyrenella longa]
MTQVHEPTAGVRRLSLRKNFSWALAGNFLYALCQVGILFVIQAVGSLEMVGAYSLALSLCVPIFLLTNLQLRTLQTTDSHREFHFSDYAGVRSLMSPLAFLILLAICSSGQYSRETVYIILAMGFAKMIETASELCYGAFQQHERLDYVSRSLCLKGILSLFLIGTTIALTGSLVLALGLVAASWFLLFVFFDFRHVYLLFREDHQHDTNKTGLKTVWSELRPRWRRFTIWKIALGGLPLGMGALLLSTTESLPNIFIEWQFGTRELGIFALLMTLSFAGLPVINAMGQAVTPRLAQNYADGNVKGFQQVMLKAVLLGTGLGIGLIIGTLLCGEWFLSTFFGPEVAVHSPLLFILMGLAPFKYGFRFFGNGLTATRRFSLVLRFQFIVLMLVVVLVPVMGALWNITGVAVAVYLTTVIRALMFAWQTRVELRAIAENPQDVQFVRGLIQAAKSLTNDLHRLMAMLKTRMAGSSGLTTHESDLGPVSPVKR